MTPSEEWRTVVGYEGHYEVSNMGRVRGLIRGRVLTPTIAGPYGYAFVSLHTPGTKRSARVHRLVAAAFLGPQPDDMEVCHGNGRAADNRLANLRYDTHSCNVSDSVAHGTHPQARKTHCPSGHEYSDANTRVDPANRRRCRSCERERSQSRREAA